MLFKYYNNKLICGDNMNTPIVILNYKTYLESSGLNALNLARDLESAAAESGITMVAVPQAADIYRISQETSLPIFAQHIDPITPGGHTGGNLIDTLVESGISGSLINHSEKRMQLADIDEVIQLCKQHNIMDLGADGVLLASGIIKAESPKDALLDLVSKL